MVRGRGRGVLKSGGSGRRATGTRHPLSPCAVSQMLSPHSRSPLRQGALRALPHDAKRCSRRRAAAAPPARPTAQNAPRHLVAVQVDDRVGDLDLGGGHRDRCCAGCGCLFGKGEETAVKKVPESAMGASGKSAPAWGRSRRAGAQRRRARGTTQCVRSFERASGIGGSGARPARRGAKEGGASRRNTDAFAASLSPRIARRAPEKVARRVLGRRKFVLGGAAKVGQTERQQRRRDASMQL